MVATANSVVHDVVLHHAAAVVVGRCFDGDRERRRKEYEAVNRGEESKKSAQQQPGSSLMKALF